MKRLKVVFMGTPEFCLPLLKMIIDCYTCVGVVTQPDKEVGRKREIVFSPVKKLALEHNVTVLQPQNIKKEYEGVINLKPDIIITCAYGQIVPEQILNYPKYGCINVHASLLPSLRGGAPIHKAIIYGLKETGITIMYMDKGMDTGDMISKEKVTISDDDTAQSLHDKLKDLAVPLLKKTITQIIEGTSNRIPQDNRKVTYAYNVSREDEHVSFDKSSKDVYNQIRGLNSWPGAYAILDDKPVKLWASKISCENGDKEPGTIIKLDKDGMLVKTADGSVLITELQMPGKKKTLVKDFINGSKKEEFVGKRFS